MTPHTATPPATSTPAKEPTAIETLRRRITIEREIEDQLLERQHQATDTIQETAEQLTELRSRIADLQSAIDIINGFHAERRSK